MGCARPRSRKSIDDARSESDLRHCVLVKCTCLPVRTHRFQSRIWVTGSVDDAFHKGFVVVCGGQWLFIYGRAIHARAQWYSLAHLLAWNKLHTFAVTYIYIVHRRQLFSMSFALSFLHFSLCGSPCHVSAVEKECVASYLQLHCSRASSSDLFLGPYCFSS